MDKKIPWNLYNSRGILWQPEKDSNPHKQSQSQAVKIPILTAPQSVCVFYIFSSTIFSTGSVKHRNSGVEDVIVLVGIDICCN